MDAAASVDTTNDIADLTKSGQAVKSRVGDPEQAQKIATKLVQYDDIRARRRAAVQDIFDGNAPKSSVALAAAGRSGDANLNWKEHRGHIMNAWTPFFDLVCEVPVCIDGDLDVGDPAQSVELMRGFAELFHKMVFGWRGFDDMNQLCDLQMLLHGPGVLAWCDEWVWHPEPILAGNFYLPDETKSSLENCEIAMIIQPITAGQLYRKIEDPKAGDAMGWHPEAVREAIMDSGTDDAIQQYGRMWMKWEQAFKNGDLYISQSLTKKIKLAILFIQEMDGTISQKAILYKSGEIAKPQFLYEKKDNYKTWDEVVCVFPYDIGADGTYHSVKGMGTDIFPFCNLLNKIKNTLADMVVTNIKPMWQPLTNAKMQDFQMVRWGGGNMVPFGVQPLQLNSSQSLMPALEISREFNATLTQNTGAYNQQELSAPTVEETAKSAMIRASERSKLTKGSYNRYMRGKDRQYAEMFRRASNPKLRKYHPASDAPLKFQHECRRLCEKIGVEWEQSLDEDRSPTGKAGKFTVLQLVNNVRANRSLGLGSAALRLEIANQLMQVIDRFDEIGQNEILRMFVATVTSFHSVDALVPSLTTQRDPTNDAAVAAQEDNAFTILGLEAEAEVVPGQNHVVHLSVHIPSMERDQQACEEQAIDPQECSKRLEAKGIHSAEHLKILDQNPTRQQEARAFGEQLRLLASYQDHLDQIIEEMEQNAPPPPQELTPEMAKVQGNLELKAQKDKGTLALRAQNQTFQHAMKDVEMAGNQRRKNWEAAAEIKRKNALAASKANGNGQKSLANPASVR